MPQPIPDITPDSAMPTPTDALDALREGNERFVGGEPVEHDVHEAIRITASGQSPFVAVLSCIDSRVPVETVFDLTIGHAFSARVAGNVVSEDVLGSLEFACAVAGTPLIVVLGHTACGAVQGACDSVELGNLTGLLAKIKPAVEETTTSGERSSSNTAFVDAVAERNAERSVEALLDQSEVLRDLVEENSVGVVPAMYDVRSGRVRFGAMHGGGAV